MTTPFAATEPVEPVEFRSPERAPLFIAGDAIGRYAVLGPIGAGGMGVVYAAYDPELDRRVALKILRGTARGRWSHPRSPPAHGDPEARARLVREAQAMARVPHANVVTVFDAGSVGEQVFIAMELVEGRTLAVWLRERARSWHEIRSAFVLAGRGLAAAHAKGLVHRDFKPSNVLVGWDDAVRVTDFGLVTSAAPPSATPAADAPAGEDAAAKITRTGALLGTPAYMSPEQYAGAPTDARADQFAFSVALFEALFGVRPFAGDTLDEVFANAAAGRVQAAAAPRRVPAWVRRAVLRGLQGRPEERFASMNALLDALAYDPRAALRRAAPLVAIATIAALAVTSAALYASRATPTPAPALCTGAEQKLAGAWDPAQKDLVSASFAKAERPFAKDAYLAIAERLDAYAGAWTAMHTDACEATRVRGEQPEDVLTLRMVCLDDRLRGLRALAKLFSEADALVVEKAVQAAQALPSVDACADTGALTQRVRPPAPAIVARVDELRARLADANALHDAGKYKEGLAIALAAEKDARAIGYAPVLAEALFTLGNLQLRTGDVKSAEASHFEAAYVAEASKADDVSARAWIDLVWLVGYRQARAEEGHRLAQQAAAAVARAGDSPELQADLDTVVANVLYTEGKYAEAAERHERSVAAREKLYGPDDTRVAWSLGNLGTALATMGRLDEALAALRRSLAIREKVLGKDHPDVATTLISIAITLRRQTHYEESIATYRRALDLYVAAYGENHPNTAMCLNNLAFAETSFGLHEDGLAHGERALAINTARLGPDHPEIADALDTTGHALVGLGRYDEGIARYERAVAVLEKSAGSSHPNVAKHRSALGEALVAAGQAKRALAPLEQALATRLAPGIAPLELAETRFATARALWDAGGDKKRARTLAEAARDAYARAGSRSLGDVERWLAAHTAR
jgi:tetratricopeptide (TPR) repeat protein